MATDIPNYNQIVNFIKGVGDNTYMSMWCRLKAQKYIDDNINDSNKHFLLDVYFEKIRPYKFNNLKPWMKDDRILLAVFPSDYTKKMNKQTTKQFLKLTRMIYFTNLYSNNSTDDWTALAFFRELFEIENGTTIRQHKMVRR